MLLAVAETTVLPVAHLLALAQFHLEEPLANLSQRAATFLLVVVEDAFVKVLTIEEVFDMQVEPEIWAIFAELRQVGVEAKTNYSCLLVLEDLGERLIKMYRLSKGNQVDNESVLGVCNLQDGWALCVMPAMQLDTPLRIDADVLLANQYL